MKRIENRVSSSEQRFNEAHRALVESMNLVPPSDTPMWSVLSRDMQLSLQTLLDATNAMLVASNELRQAYVEKEGAQQTRLKIEGAAPAAAQ